MGVSDPTVCACCHSRIHSCPPPSLLNRLWAANTLAAMDLFWASTNERIADSSDPYASVLFSPEYGLTRRVREMTHGSTQGIARIAPCFGTPIPKQLPTVAKYLHGRTFKAPLRSVKYCNENGGISVHHTDVVGVIEELQERLRFWMPPRKTKITQLIRDWCQPGEGFTLKETHIIQYELRRQLLHARSEKMTFAPSNHNWWSLLEQVHIAVRDGDIEDKGEYRVWARANGSLLYPEKSKYWVGWGHFLYGVPALSNLERYTTIKLKRTANEIVAKPGDFQCQWGDHGKEHVDRSYILDLYQNTKRRRAWREIEASAVKEPNQIVEVPAEKGKELERDIFGDAIPIYDKEVVGTTSVYRPDSCNAIVEELIAENPPRDRPSPV